MASGLVLRKGMGAEGLAWSLTFVLLPLCCVYYPVSRRCPAWLQWVALALPPTHVFEGLRTLLLSTGCSTGVHAHGAGAERRLPRRGHGHGVRAADPFVALVGQR